MSEEGSTQPRWWYLFDAIFKCVVLAGGVIAYFSLQLPARQDASRIAGAEADVVELKAHQIKQPVLQVLPSMSQSASVEDVREIRLALEFSNIGECSAILETIDVQVDNGSPIGEAANTVKSAIRYYYERLNEQLAVAGQYPERPAYYAEVPRSLPPHDPCPHGRIYAVSASTPDLKWTPVERAKQTISRQQLLRPRQSASHAFTYLLTEYPLQHHRQWLRFRVVVEYRSEEETEILQKQEYELYLSGLPLPRADDSICAPTEQCSGTTSLNFWQPNTPLMPLETKK